MRSKQEVLDELATYNGRRTGRKQKLHIHNLYREYDEIERAENKEALKDFHG